MRQASSSALVVAGLIAGLCSTPGLPTGQLFSISIANAATLAPVSAEEAKEIAIEAYTYAYPLVLMEITRRSTTNVEEPNESGEAPMNRFGAKRTFPDASFTKVVRANADTLYSMMWYDVAKEPLIISVPDSEGRYYLLPTLDMWTDVFSSPGSRTTGTGKQTYALVGPHWRGELPDGISAVRSPTSIGWVVGRTQTNGAADYANVHKFQDELTATPLSAWGKKYTPQKAKINPDWDMTTPPVEQVAKMGGKEFFSLFAELTKENPPHANDYPILDRMNRIGMQPGKSLDFGSLPQDVQTALNEAGQPALKAIIASAATSGILANGWRTNLTAIGTYGADYLHRAAIAYFGLGANTIEDSIYPTAFGDEQGKPMSSDKSYVLHFNKDQIPPVNAFWSATMYNDKQFMAANPINRFAIGDRDKLKFNADGSLDIYLQRMSPGADKEANWLPTPESGDFTLNLRLYWPKRAALNQSWSPPSIKAVE